MYRSAHSKAFSGEEPGWPENADEGELARIAVEVSVQRLAEARAIVLATGKAGDLVGACPLCDDAEGLAVSPTSNVWACSSCGEGGGPVEWLMATEGVSKAHAVELLREGLPATSASTGRKPPKVNSRALLPAPFEPGTTNDDLLEQVVAFYHRTLREAPQRPRIWSAASSPIRRWWRCSGWGSRNRTLGYRLPEKNRAAGKVLRTQLQEIGVWSAKGHEAYDGSLVVPITDINGQLAQLYGRKIGQHLRKGTRLHTWLATTERPLFNPAALDVGDEVVLAGSVIDASTLWCAGFRHTIGVDGVEGFDDTHLAQLADAGVRSVRIAYRRDDTGEHAARGPPRRCWQRGSSACEPSGRGDWTSTTTRASPRTRRARWARSCAPRRGWQGHQAHVPSPATVGGEAGGGRQPPTRRHHRRAGMRRRRAG